MTAIDIHILETWRNGRRSTVSTPRFHSSSAKQRQRVGMEPTTLVSHPGDTLPTPICLQPWVTHQCIPKRCAHLLSHALAAGSTVGGGRIVSIISASLYFIVVIVYCNDLVMFVLKESTNKLWLCNDLVLFVLEKNNQSNNPTWRFGSNHHIHHQLHSWWSSGCHSSLLQGTCVAQFMMTQSKGGLFSPGWPATPDVCRWEYLRIAGDTKHTSWIFQK